jgi:hypothetical protein
MAAPLPFPLSRPVRDDGASMAPSARRRRAGERVAGQGILWAAERISWLPLSSMLD